MGLARDWHTAAEAGQALHLALHDRLRSRRVTVAAALSEAQETKERALEGLMAILQLHDRDGRGHAVLVARLAIALADELGVDDEEMRLLRHGARLHDIGKIDVPASILAKPAPLTDQEYGHADTSTGRL